VHVAVGGRVESIDSLKPALSAPGSLDFIGLLMAAKRQHRIYGRRQSYLP
jgi:hypothetical protein